MAAGSDSESFDSALPLRGVVVCCTSIPPDQRTEIASCTAEMGGIHKYDLTPDITHLIVGEYDTPKYRHVAKERPDIIPMAPGWIRALRYQFVRDENIDFEAVQDEWRLRTFETGGGVAPDGENPDVRNRRRLLCCLTGFEDGDMRAEIEDKVTANGGEYTGDLSRKVTHLIVHKPEGRKYVAAKNWGLQTVSIEWLNDSIGRGMILDESCYDPLLPLEERGKGAWVRRRVSRESLGKRLRDGGAPNGSEGRRKLRKTASMKLNTQRDNLWGDILVKRSSTDLSKVAPPVEERAASIPAVAQSGNASVVADQPPPDSMTQPTQAAGPVFSSCRFYVHGFDQRRTAIVCTHLESNGAQISPSLEDVASPHHIEELGQRFVVVSQTSAPGSHPRPPEGVNVVTEFYIERCMHNRYLFHPNEHVLGRPFLRFPIAGLQSLTICTAGFKNEQLNQVEKTLVQLGAKYSERLNGQTSLLVCPSIGNVRKQKLDFAVTAKVPIVSANWLWRCIETGCYLPWKDFLCKEIDQASFDETDSASLGTKESLQRIHSEPMPTKPKTEFRGPPPKTGVDRSAFEDDVPRKPQMQRHETHESHYQTAPTHQQDSDSTRKSPAPLGEKSKNALNRSPSPQKLTTIATERKLKRFPTGGTVGDSQTADEDESDVASGSRSEVPSDTEKTRRADILKNNNEKERAEAVAEKQRADEAKAEKNSREKQEMSKRLNSLVGGHEEVAVAATEDDGVRPAGAPPSRAPARRRREILGRAQSNVSAASSGSADSSAVATAAGDGMVGGGYGDDGERPSTQLEYDNPDARNQRATILKRVFGTTDTTSGEGSNKSRANDGGARGPSSSTHSMGFYSFSGNGGVGSRTRTRREKGF